MRENVTIDDVGNAAVFLASDLSAKITGEVLYVDSGFNTIGVQISAKEEKSEVSEQISDQYSVRAGASMSALFVLYGKIDSYVQT